MLATIVLVKIPTPTAISSNIWEVQEAEWRDEKLYRNTENNISKVLI